MIEIRKRHPAFGLGAFKELAGSNPSVLAFVREFDPSSGRRGRSWDSTRRPILCVNNLSRFPQPVELDLRRSWASRPVECMGGVHFPPIGELPYLLTLPDTASTGSSSRRRGRIMTVSRMSGPGTLPGTGRRSRKRHHGKRGRWLSRMR